MSDASWTQLAQSDLAEVDDYDASRSPEFAERVDHADVAAAESFGGIPAGGRSLPTGSSHVNVPATPYILLYRPVIDGVEILRLHHERQNCRQIR